MNKRNPMKKDRHTSSRLLALLLCLPIALCTAFSMMAMAQGEIIDVETYNGVVILEDPALIGDVEDGETTIEPTTIPTEAPSVEPTQAPSTEPSQEPTQAPTDPPVVSASYEIIIDAPSGWYLNRAAIGEVVSVLTTDAGGTAETGWLDWGRYRITETKVPLHFVDNHFSAEIDAFENGKTYVVEVENEPTKGWIRLTKTDRQNGNPIAGIQFDIYYNDEYGSGLAATMVTGADGVAISEPLRKGRYIVKEHGQTAGYVFEEVTLDATVKSDETTELTATNQPVQVRLKLYKRDADEYDGDNPNGTAKAKESTALPTPASISAPAMRGDGVLTGAEFQVLAGADITDRQGNVVYHDNQTPVVIETVTVSNSFLPAEITLQKEKESLQTVHGNDGTVTQIIITNDPGEGFVFGLYNDKDISYSGGTLMADTLVATGVTDANGSLTFSGCYPHGHYYITELYAPAGWKLNPNIFPVTLDPAAKAEDANVIRVALPEAVHDELIHTTITLTKQDIAGEKTLHGALIVVENGKGEVIYRATTDKNGQIPNIPVVPGKYTFREILAPDGYALNVAEMTFTVDEYGNVTGDTVIRDDYSRVTLLKQNEEGLPLAGVEFALLKADGSTLMTAVSNEIGLVTFEKIPFGSYTIAETAPPSGYLKSEINVQLTVDGSFVNADKPIETIVNSPNEIILHKVNTEGTVLQGAAFALFNAYGEQVMAAVADENGVARFAKVPYGDYTLRETQAPDGYNLMEDIHLTVDASWTKPVEYIGVDIPDHYEFIKVDNRGNPLAGAKFVLEDSEGDYLRELVSGDDGVVHVTDLTPGRYTIRETEALEGFNKSDENISVVIDEHYIAPVELYRFVNYSGIQTGFEMEMTPVMWAGVALVVVGAALLLVQAKHSKEKAKRHKHNLKQRRR